MNGLEVDYGERIVFQRINVDEPEGRRAVQFYRVRGHPTVILLDEQGNIFWSRVGAQSRQGYEQAIKSLLSR